MMAKLKIRYIHFIKYLHLNREFLRHVNEFKKLSKSNENEDSNSFSKLFDIFRVIYNSIMIIMIIVYFRYHGHWPTVQEKQLIGQMPSYTI